MEAAEVANYELHVEVAAVEDRVLVVAERTFVFVVKEMDLPSEAQAVVCQEEVAWSEYWMESKSREPTLAELVQLQDRRRLKQLESEELVLLA